METSVRPYESDIFGTPWSINTKARSQILERAVNCAVKADAEKKNNQDMLSSIQTLEGANPDKYRKWTPLPIWSCTNMSLQQTVEPMMHLLFLGLMKNNTLEIQDWAALRKQFSYMRQSLREALQPISDIKLSWCKTQPYKGDKLGGWVSENFLAFARIAPWAYSTIGEWKDDPPFEKP